MTDAPSLDQLTHAVEALIISDNLQDSMASVSETFAHLGRAIEQSKGNASLWDHATRLAQTVAGKLVSEPARASLGEADGISHVARLLQLAESDTFRIQALRVLGNACIDYDDNRKRVHDAGVVAMVIPFLQEHQNPELTKVACGFCLNSSMDFDPIQKAIGSSSGIEYLSKLLKPARLDHGELMTVMLAARALDNLVREDSARAAFVSCDSSIERLLDLIKYQWQVDRFENLDLLGSLVDILIQAVAEDEAAQNAVVDSPNFIMLLDFVENAELPDEEELEEEEKKQFEEIMNTVTKSVVCAISSDSKMNELYKNDELLSRLIGWARSSQSEVLAQTGVYALANLARSDEICIDLVKRHHLDKALLEAFKSTDKATFRYAVLGCLKHLCLPKENKATIGESDAIGIIAPLLETTNDMLKRNQFLTIGIIRLLCTNEYTNSERVVIGPAVGSEGKTPLELVLACLDRFDDVAAKSEATRILTTVIKSAWFRQDNEASAPLRRKLLDQRVIGPIVELTRASNFPVLKNDGVIALTSVLTAWQLEDPQDLIKLLPLVEADAPPVPEVVEEVSEEQQQQAKPEIRSFLQVITGMMMTTSDAGRPIPPEMQWNVCVLLEKIVEAAKGVQYQSAVDKIKTVSGETLEQAAQRGDMVGPAAQKVLAALQA